VIVGGCSPQYVEKLRNCRIFVKYGTKTSSLAAASALMTPITRCYEILLVIGTME
jgi:hypothetical protein